MSSKGIYQFQNNSVFPLMVCFVSCSSPLYFCSFVIFLSLWCLVVFYRISFLTFVIALLHFFNISYLEEKARLWSPIWLSITLLYWTPLRYKIQLWTSAIERYGESKVVTLDICRSVPLNKLSNWLQYPSSSGQCNHRYPTYKRGSAWKLHS